MNNSKADSTVLVAQNASCPSGEFVAVMGIDVGDRYSRFHVLDWSTGKELRKGRIPTTASGLSRLLEGDERMRVAIETGTHSGWMSRHIQKLGHEVIVANSRKLRAIYENDRKNDAQDALMLARLARVDPNLLSPIQHRGGQAQADLAVLRARNELVACRTKLINSVRGTVKAFGEHLRSCSSACFHKKVAGQLPRYLEPALKPLVTQIEQLTSQIRAYDQLVVHIAKHRYAATARLQEVTGVGPITALAYVLTIEDTKRFKSARSVGAYLGLCPKLDDSGDLSKQLRITKAGDTTLRSLMVNCSHYILGPFGPDCDLRRHGLKLALRGGQNAKRRAVVAVARKLAVLLFALWANDTKYEPLRQANSLGATATTS